jgi:hypothetical protein
MLETIIMSTPLLIITQILARTVRPSLSTPGVDFAMAVTTRKMVFSDSPESSLQPLKWLLLTISNDFGRRKSGR